MARPFEHPHYDELPVLALKSGQIRLNVIASPINPADINMLEGMYVTQPEPPFVLGNEGVGEVVECGPDVPESWLGQRVIVPYQHQEMWDGWWQEQRVVSIHHCIQVPESISAEQAAMLSINPITAYELLARFTALNPGDWIIQNAANSGLGHAVIQLAKSRGIRTINLCRRPNLTDALKSAGADAVWVDQKDIFKEIRDQYPDAPIKLGLNGVGGQSAKEVAKTLSPQGTMVTYGAMGREPVTLSNRLLIYDDKRFVGFNRTRWVKSVTGNVIRDRFKALKPIFEKNEIKAPIEKVYPLDAYKEAIVHAGQSKRSGKILLDLQSPLK